MEAENLNRITRLFIEKKERLLNVYFTAGYPGVDDTLRVAKSLEKAGADLLEIGIPYSDPIADGPTIQESSTQAISNGMTIERLFNQLEDLRSEVKIPVLLMGYLNPVIQYGIEAFCKKCKEVGVDGLILPDLPMHEYQEVYEPIFDEYGIYNVFLVTPQTAENRIRIIDQNSQGFIYLVSSASITGAKSGISEEQVDYFRRIDHMKLNSPTLIGFGISNKNTFDTACRYAQGAIIGSAFIKQLSEDASDEAIQGFVKKIIS
jgi:tryptophan synthase alpha chain